MGEVGRAGVRYDQDPLWRSQVWFEKLLLLLAPPKSRVEFEEPSYVTCPQNVTGSHGLPVTGRRAQ